jgi:hypothetical protein
MLAIMIIPIGARGVNLTLKNSTNNIVFIISEIASPSIPSIKLIELTIIKQNNYEI